jgi:hypothetical protein
MNKYLELEEEIAKYLGWFGIVRLNDSLIGYESGANPNKSFRSSIPEYSRDMNESSFLAQSYQCHVSEGDSSCSGDMYVTHYKDHSSPEQAKMYLIALEVLEKLEEAQESHQEF